jgi:hypothetical protein
VIQIGTAEFHGNPISATSTDQGAVYRSEARITAAARAAGACERTDPHECRDDMDYCERCNGYRLYGHYCTTTTYQEGTDQ